MSDKSTKKFEFPKNDGTPITAQEAVFQAISAASMCWKAPVGTFYQRELDSARAREVGEALIKVILEEILSPAWGLIANAGEADWDDADNEWRQAAIRWCDEKFHPFIIARTVSATDESEQATNHVERATEMLALYGQAIRNSWNLIDGRNVRDAMDDISAVVQGGSMTVDEFCADYGCCRKCKVWVRNCYCGATND